MRKLLRPLITVLAAVSWLAWPVAASLAFMLLQAPANAWSPLSYAVLVSLAIHYPLWSLSRRRILAVGERASRDTKLLLAWPVLTNCLFLFMAITYLGAVCFWRFTCTHS